MELVMNGMTELNEEEMMLVDGGGWFSSLVGSYNTGTKTIPIGNKKKYTDPEGSHYNGSTGYYGKHKSRWSSIEFHQ